MADNMLMYFLTLVLYSNVVAPACHILSGSSLFAHGVLVLLHLTPHINQVNGCMSRLLKQSANGYLYSFDAKSHSWELLLALLDLRSLPSALHTMLLTIQ